MERIMKDNPIILIVDDQPQNIELLEAHLLPQGYGIVKASGGEEALDKLVEYQIDLVLLDIMMPGLNGFDVTRLIRQDERFRLLPIILVTALWETEDRVKGIEAGCDDFITKPLDKMELLARVRSLLKVKAYNDLAKNFRKELESEVSIITEDLRVSVKKVKSDSLETIHRLAMVSDFKDKSNSSHINLMSLYSAVIARQMGLKEDTIETLLYAACMHDLGKVGMPDYILQKPTKLNPEEWEIMKQHTIIGAKILKGSGSEYINMGEIIAMHHHEKWDGSGYPHGLKGIEIPIVCRITSLADVFDVLVTKRPYKEAYSIDKAFSIIKEGRGSHFDPNAVDAFFAVEDKILKIKKQYEGDEKPEFNISLSFIEDEE
jgi:putative two-component system response regulator